MISSFGILLLLTLLLLVIGSITDIKWRIVPDWLSYAAIAAGLSIRILDSIITITWQPVLEGLLGFGVFFVLACVAFYTKMWGGGDSKVLMAMGALLGFWWSPNHIMVAVSINFLIVGGLYGLGYFLVLASMHHHKVLSKAKMLLSVKAVARIHVVILCILGLFIVTTIATKTSSFLVLGLGFAVIFYLFVLSKSIEQTCFIKDVPLSQVEEGDWIVNQVKVRGKVLAGPKDTGISKEQINKIKKLSKKYKIKTLRVKEGIPFIPNFLLTFLVTIMYGNIVFKVLGIG